MGTYYRYVNYTREEFVCLSDLRDGGDTENAVLYCAPALAWLIVWPHTCGDGYRGRWAPQREAGVERSDDVRIVGDGAVDFADMDDTFLNITPGLLQSMRDQVPGFVEDYQPRFHDVQLVQRTRSLSPSYELADPVSAACKCGWRMGPIYGESREHVLEWTVAAHVNDGTMSAGSGNKQVNEAKS
jgi:hypothetical protein